MTGTRGQAAALPGGRSPFTSSVLMSLGHRDITLVAGCTTDVSRMVFGHHV